MSYPVVVLPGSEASDWLDTAPAGHVRRAVVRLAAAVALVIAFLALVAFSGTAGDGVGDVRAPTNITSTSPYVPGPSSPAAITSTNAFTG